MKEIYKHISVIRLLFLVGIASVLVLATQQPAMTAPCAHLPRTQVPGSGQCQAAAALPPRPTPSPTPIPPSPPTPTSTPSKPAAEAAPQQEMSGGVIQLEVSFASEWSWDQTHWQTLWTIVQWQGPEGHWQDVKGWQGTLDKLVNTRSSASSHRIPLKQLHSSEQPVSLHSFKGYKSWWVGAEDLGRGPFRWVIYKSQDGALLSTSEPFNLPATSGECVKVKVTLEQ